MKDKNMNSADDASGMGTQDISTMTQSEIEKLPVIGVINLDYGCRVIHRGLPKEDGDESDTEQGGCVAFNPWNGYQPIKLPVVVSLAYGCNIKLKSQKTIDEFFQEHPTISSIREA